MSQRYTAVFEWDGEVPAVGAGDGWLGGRLVRLTLDDERTEESGGSREFHEVVIDGRTYRTTNQKLVEEIQRQTLEIQEMGGRLIAAHRTLQNVRGQLCSAQLCVAALRREMGALSDAEVRTIRNQIFSRFGPITEGFVRMVVEAADGVRATRATPPVPDDSPGLADALAHAAVIEEEHRYLSSALLSRCGPRAIGETWVDYARRCMGQS